MTEEEQNKMEKDILFQIDMQLYDEFNEKLCEMNDNLGTIYTYKDIMDLEEAEKDKERKLLREAVKKLQADIDRLEKKNKRYEKYLKNKDEEHEKVLEFIETEKEKLQADIEIKDKVIDKMINWIGDRCFYSDDYCNSCEIIQDSCYNPIKDCENCIKQYIYGKVENNE